jgi:hypothetical protein
MYVKLERKFRDNEISPKFLRHFVKFYMAKFPIYPKFNSHNGTVR